MTWLPRDWLQQVGENRAGLLMRIIVTRAESFHKKTLPLSMLIGKDEGRIIYLKFVISYFKLPATVPRISPVVVKSICFITKRIGRLCLNFDNKCYGIILDVFIFTIIRLFLSSNTNTRWFWLYHIPFKFSLTIFALQMFPLRSIKELWLPVIPTKLFETDSAREGFQ